MKTLEEEEVHRPTKKVAKVISNCWKKFVACLISDSNDPVVEVGNLGVDTCKNIQFAYRNKITLYSLNEASLLHQKEEDYLTVVTSISTANTP